jgi:hypothetical protein
MVLWWLRTPGQEGLARFVDASALGVQLLDVFGTFELARVDQFLLSLRMESVLLGHAGAVLPEPCDTLCLLLVLVFSVIELVEHVGDLCARVACECVRAASHYGRLSSKGQRAEFDGASARSSRRRRFAAASSILCCTWCATACWRTMSWCSCVEMLPISHGTVKDCVDMVPTA